MFISGTNAGVHDLQGPSRTFKRGWHQTSLEDPSIQMVKLEMLNAAFWNIVGNLYGSLTHDVHRNNVVNMVD